MSEEIADHAIRHAMATRIGLYCMVTPDKEKPAKCGFVMVESGRFVASLAPV